MSGPSAFWESPIATFTSDGGAPAPRRPAAQPSISARLRRRGPSPPTPCSVPLGRRAPSPATSCGSAFHLRSPRTAGPQPRDVLRLSLPSPLASDGGAPAPRRPAAHTAALGRLLAVLGHELHIQGQALQLLHEHVEGLRRARLEEGLSLHDGFVDPVAALDVVRLDR